MEALEALLTRRAVREYTSEPVTEEELQTILRAAMHAPSACNQQPWHFIVVDDRETLNAIAARHPYAQMLLQAPMAISVCADVTLETCRGHWTSDCSAAMENLLLAAHALGLGSVWVAVHPAEQRVQAVRELLHLPNFVVPLCLAPLGHAAGPLPKVDRFNPARVHRGGW